MTAKLHFGRDLGPLGLNSGQFFFSRIWLRLSLDIMVNYHHVQQKKTNDLILRQLSDGRTDGRIHGQTDKQRNESDFIGRCPTNVKRPTGTAFSEKNMRKSF